MMAVTKFGHRMFSTNCAHTARLGGAKDWCNYISCTPLTKALALPNSGCLVLPNPKNGSSGFDGGGLLHCWLEGVASGGGQDRLAKPDTIVDVVDGEGAGLLAEGARRAEEVSSCVLALGSCRAPLASTLHKFLPDNLHLLLFFTVTQFSGHNKDGCEIQDSIEFSFPPSYLSHQRIVIPEGKQNAAGLKREASVI